MSSIFICIAAPAAFSFCFCFFQPLQDTVGLFFCHLIILLASRRASAEVSEWTCGRSKKLSNFQQLALTGIPYGIVYFFSSAFFCILSL